MRAPALVSRSFLVRFGAMTVCALVILGLAATFLLRGVVGAEARTRAEDEAVSFAQLAVQQALSPADLVHGVDAQSRSALDRVARAAHRLGRFAEITVWSRRGEVVYTSARAAGAHRSPSPQVRAGLAGHRTSVTAPDRHDGTREAGRASGPFEA